MSGKNINWECKFIMKVVTLLILTTAKISHGQTLHYSIFEEEEPNQLVGNVKLDANLSPDRIDQFIFSFRYHSGNYLLFTIDRDLGIIKTKKTIDRESVCPHTDPCIVELDITVRPMEYFKIIKVTIKILDVNDHAPEFPQSKVIRSISEEIVPGITFPLPNALDPDSGVNAIQRYTIEPLSGSPTRKFGLHISNNADGTKDISLQVNQKLDREEESSYSFVISAYDGGQPPKSGSMVVEIAVTDSNDNNPVFDQPTYEVEIKENIPIHRTITSVHASDPDSGNNGKVIYSFSSHTSSLYGHLFGMNNETGDIFVKGEINYEVESIYHLTVTATDKGPNSRPAFCKVVITVIDENDHPPKISINTLTDSGFAEVMENAEPGAFVSHVSVSDPDQGDAGNIKCSVDKAKQALFELQQISDTFEFKVVTKKSFDRELEPTHQVSVICEDLGSPALSAAKVINVHIMDVNDHEPQFSTDRYYARVEENSDVNLYVAQIVANDLDEGQNAQLTYSLKGIKSEDNNLLRMDPISGIIKTNTVFDFEKKHNYQYLIKASDHGHPPKSSAALLNITIIDSNDEAPQFTEKSYTFTIKENQPTGSIVGQISATDKDAKPYNKISYFIDASNKGHDNFEITNSGEIYITKSLDREKISEYNIIVVAHNEGYANTISKVPVKIHIDDENDNKPVIHFPNPSNKSVTVSGQTPVGHVIAIINATDPDVGKNGWLFYRILNGNDDGMFVIDNSTGVISVAKSLKEINHQAYTLIIAVKDSGLNVAQEEKGSLRIVVDKNVPFAPAAHSNLTNIDGIMLPLGIIVGIIILLMIVILAILIVKYRHRRVNKAHKYNCRLEANKTLINGPHLRHDDHVGKTYQADCDKDIRSSSDDMIMSGDEDTKEAIHSGMMMDFHRDHCPMNVHGVHHPFTETELHRQNKMPDVVNLSHLEVDSECSGADSGKGTSEEGDYTQSNHSSPNSDILDIPEDHVVVRNHHECDNNYPQQRHQEQVPAYYSTHPNTGRQQDNLDAGPAYSSDLELYNYHRNYSPLTTFSSKPHSIDISQGKLDRSFSPGKSNYSGSSNIDNVRSKLQNIKSISHHRNPRDISYRGYQRCAQSSQSNSPIEEELIAYPPPPPPPVCTDKHESYKTEPVCVNNKAFDSSPDSWAGREGSMRGRQDGRRHLFGNQLNFDNNELSDNLTVPGSSGQKSAFRTVGGNQRNTLKQKKEVRFADKCVELNNGTWTDEEMLSSADGLSEDGASITSGCYILDSGTAHIADTFV